MAIRVVTTALPLETRIASETSDIFDTRVSPLRRAFLTLYVTKGGAAGTTPKLDCRVVGGPESGSSYMTSIYCYSAKGTGPLSGRSGFTQITTAGRQVKYAESFPRFWKVISTLTGSSPSFRYGFYVDAEAD